MPTRLLPYQEPLRAYCAHRVPRRDLDDVVQDVWLKVFASPFAYRDEHALIAWLYGVARSVIIDRSRRHSWPLAIDPDWNPPGTSPSPADDLVMREQRRALARAILRLTPKQACVIACHYIAGLTDWQTGEHMGLCGNAVKSLRNRGLKSLRAEWSAPLS